MPFHRRSFLKMAAASGAGRAFGMPTLALGPPPAVPQVQVARVAQGGDPWIEISTANLLWNLRQIQARVAGKAVMAVVKANAYGHGLVGIAGALESAGVHYFLVGKVDEARALRAAGLRRRILNFGPYTDADVEDLVRLGISQNVYTDQVQSLDRATRRVGRKACVHIKVDTGLGRVGVAHDRALDFVERVAALRGVMIEGVFTTLTEDPEFDPIQLARFGEICARMNRSSRSPRLRHAASSAAILDLPAAYTELDMVRPGIMLYGLYPSAQAERQRKLNLRPVLALKTRVTQVKTLRPGDAVSYHRAYKATAAERIATLSAGYSDGLPWALAEKGNVLIGRRRCPIVAITSNATIVRLRDAAAVPGDEAVLLGAQGQEEITASEVAGLTGSTVYRVAMGMSALLPRLYS